ncbi:MAG TPA: outer membrane protein transport protein [Burkholderiales bacterium]|nr:outer membrane protein transport protein [Burkholderiales bacterium]
MRKALIGAAVAAALAPGMALATDGYFQDGYGMKANGMGGVGIALPQDALAPATNPAGLTMVGDRLDVGATLFRPVRGADIQGNPGLQGTYDGNDAQNFIIPEFGYSKMINPGLAAGVAVYGNGGMNTKYKQSPFAAFGGTSPTGVNLNQLFVSPTVAYKINPNNSIGLALNLAYQQFGLSGLRTSAFAGFSSDGAHFSDQGNDSSTGWGVRIGWTGQITPAVTLGATYQTKTKMSKLSDYAGLFANQGEFDIPENYGIGIAVKTTPRLTLAADVEQINYSKVAAVGDPVDSLFAGSPFGATNGPGFGWNDVTVLKVGASYAYSDKLTLRAGFNTLKQPIPSNQTLLNILAPGVVEDQVSLGATWALSDKSEVTVAYMHAFSKTVNGSGSIPPSFGGGEANLTMYQDSIGIAYGLKM